LFRFIFENTKKEKLSRSIVVSIFACHVDDLESIPDNGEIFTAFLGVARILEKNKVNGYPN